MRPLRAILLLPVAPASAAAALGPWAALAAPAPPVLLLLALLARGCRASDAALAALGLLLLVLGLGAGGAFAALVARRAILPDAPRRGLHVHLALAAWSMTLLLAALLATGSALAAGMLVLVWGVVAGTRVLAAEAEPGRALVASCAGTMGAILGMLVLGMVVHRHLVMAMPDPAGGTLLVRRGEAPEPGARMVVLDRASAVLFVARQGPQGLVPEGSPPPGPPAGWVPVGRAFFFLGAGARAGRAIPP
jgi:hypothetical protein